MIKLATFLLSVVERELKYFKYFSAHDSSYFCFTWLYSAFIQTYVKQDYSEMLFSLKCWSL